MTILETRSRLAPEEVIERARTFFALSGTPYAASPEQAGDGHLRLHMDVGEVVIATVREEGATRVRGSASRGRHLLARFISTLAPPLDAMQTTHRHGLRASWAARVETYPAPAAVPAAAEVEPAPQAA